MANKKFSDEEIKNIYKKEYLRGLSSSKLGEKYGVYKGYFSREFKRLGLEIRTQKQATRKYTVNDNYFNKIDSHEKAYWLGFIYADGFISIDPNKSNTKRIGISLSVKDESHLLKFSECINSNYPIKKYKVSSGYKVGVEYCRLLINSDTMFDDLLHQGVFLQKTAILQPPNIKYQYIKSFILGYFDGDGCICVKNHYDRGTKDWNFGLCGTFEILEFITNYFIENKLVYRKNKFYKKNEDSTVYQLAYGGINVKRILSHLYSEIDINLVLERKYELYIKCKNKKFD